MTRHAFVIVDDRVVEIANASGAGLQYQGQLHRLPPGLLVGPILHDHAETVIVIVDGIVEVMINGLAGFVGAGSFIRITASTHFAYRNAGEDIAHVICRTAPTPAARRSMRVHVHLTAA